MSGAESTANTDAGAPEASDGDDDVLGEWAIFGIGLAALAGLGFGMIDLVLDAIDEPLLDADDVPWDEFGSLFEAVFSASIMDVPHLAVLLSLAFGLYLGLAVDLPADELYKIDGVVAAGGTVVFWVIAAVFGAAAIDGVSIDFGGLLINAIVAGIIAALVAAGATWIGRNRAPSSIGSEPSDG